MERKLENTQQRARRISTKASVWASSASQSNIWKHFLSCNNKNMQHPRFQAQHSCIKPHCPLWSGLRKEAYTEIQRGLNASAQTLHSMTTQLRERAQPLSDGRSCEVIPKDRRSHYTIVSLHERRFGVVGGIFLRRAMFKNVLFQSWVNVMIISFA